MTKNTWVLCGMVAAKLILHYLLIGPGYELHRDEFLHLDQGRHLAWGYISVPPLSSWISVLIHLLGNGIFWVKFFPAAFGALTIILGWKITRALNGGLFACVLVSLSLLVSVILRINILFQPNSTDIFFWTLLYFTVLRYIQTESVKWIYFAAIAFAFGMLSKYNIAFALLGLVPALILTEHRRLFVNKHLYLAMLVGLLILLPNIVWQVRNHFPTVVQLRELAAKQLVHVQRADFLKEQLLFFISSIFVIIAGFAGLIGYPPFKKYRLFGISFLVSFSLFILLKAKGYYAIGLYPLLIAFGSVYLEHVLSNGWKRWLRPVAFAAILVLSIPFFLIAFPIKSPAAIAAHPGLHQKFGLLRWEDGKDHTLPQDFADMLGWKELALKVDAAYSQVNDKENTLVLCDNYGEAGAINYYSKYPQINALSFNADYVNWVRPGLRIHHLILVQEADDDDPAREREKPYFQSAQLIGKIKNSYAREKGTSVYLLKDGTGGIDSLFRQQVREYRNIYFRPS